MKRVNLKVKWNGNNITNVIGSMIWLGSAYSAARSLEFTILNPAGDKHFKNLPNIKTGDVICMYKDSDKLFHGKITKGKEKVKLVRSLIRHKIFYFI